MPLWDVHTHCYSVEYLRLLEDYGHPYRIRRSAAGHPVIAWGDIPVVTLHPGTYTLAQRFEDPRQRQVGVHVVSTTVPGVYPLPPAQRVRAARLINDELAAWRDAYPDRVRGLASLPFGTDEAVTELDRAVGHLGLSGVIVGTQIGVQDLDHPAFEPVFRRADDLGTVVLLHPMVPRAGAEYLAEHDLLSLVGFMSATTEAVARLIATGFFARYPRIRFVLPQLGGAALFWRSRWAAGWQGRPEADRLREPLPHVFYDTVVFSADVVRFARDAVGVSQLLFGSDYPHLGDADTVWRAVSEALPADAERRAVGEANAARLFGATG
jgi:aminocarboxymuconate-semialdehyde decarboxylase